MWLRRIRNVAFAVSAGVAFSGGCVDNVQVQQLITSSFESLLASLVNLIVSGAVNSIFGTV